MAVAAVRAAVGAGVVASNLAAALFGMCVVRRRLGHLDGLAGVRQPSRPGICVVGAALITWRVAAYLGPVHDRADGRLILVITAPVFAGVHPVLARLLHANEIWTLLAPIRSLQPPDLANRWHREVGQRNSKTAKATE